MKNLFCQAIPRDFFVFTAILAGIGVVTNKGFFKMKYYINFDIEHIADLVKCFDRKYERETKLAVKLILNDSLSSLYQPCVMQALIRSP